MYIYIYIFISKYMYIHIYRHTFLHPYLFIYDSKVGGKIVGHSDGQRSEYNKGDTGVGV